MVVLLVGFNVVTWLADRSRGPALAPGTRVPAVALSSPDGGEVVVGAAGARATVLEFWATWCPPCQRSLPALGALAASYAGRPARFVAVNVDAQSPDRLPAVDDTLTALGLRGLEVALDDGRASRGYRVDRLPHTVVLDADGGIAAQWTGAWDGAELSKALDELLRVAQKEQTRPAPAGPGTSAQPAGAAPASSRRILK